MTPVARFAALAAGRAVDRLPCVPIVGNTAARVIGVRVSQLRRNGGELARAQLASYRRFGYDVIRVFTDLYVLAEAMGARVNVPDDETAYLAEPVITSTSAIAGLRAVEPTRDGCLPAHLEATRRLVEEVGAEVAVTTALTGPFTTASFLVGADTLARLCVREPEAVSRLCEICLESGLRWADAIIAAGASPSITDPMLSSTVVGPRVFRTHGLPTLRRLIEHIHLQGRTVTLHICGKTKPVWSLMADSGADCLSLDDEADLAEAKQAVGHRVRLMGNVPPVAVVQEGPREMIREAVRRCVRQAADNPKGFIVASGCSLPVETPFAHIEEMVRATEELGWPTNGEVA
jgi:uroporphyrinogen decarboxylase